MTRPPKPTLVSIKKMTEDSDINAGMTHVFNECQFSMAGHKKLLVIMKCLFYRSVELNKLDYFSLRFCQLLNHSLVIKKGDHNADRVCKLIAHFVKLLAEESAKLEAKDDEVEEEVDETTITESHSKFTFYLITHLLRGIDASNKTVRYRVVQLLALMIKYMGDLDVNIFKLLIVSLSKRLHDREIHIRMQAVIALSNFQYFEIDFEEEDEQNSQNKITSQLLIEWLMTCLQLDDSAEVRRTAMLNVNKTKHTLNLLLERVKDVNSINRRLVFSKITPELGLMKNLKPKQREILMQFGLHDRDRNVSDAATRLLCDIWFESCKEDLNLFLELLNVTKSQIAEKALLLLFKEKPEILKKIEINRQFWKALTVESSFLMKTFFIHCNNNRLYNLIEANFPDPLELSDTLKKYLDIQKKIKNDQNDIHQIYETHNKEINNIENEMFVLENSFANINLKLHANQKKLQMLEQLDVKKTTQQKSDIKRLKTEIKNLQIEFKQNEEQYKKCTQHKAVKINGFTADREKYEEYADMMKDLSFIANQLLMICIDFDFSDEVGRRAMLNVIRSQLREENFHDEIIVNSLKVLKKISINEKDFVSMTVEIITDIRDSNEDGDVFGPSLQEKSIKQTNDGDIDMDEIDEELNDLDSDMEDDDDGFNKRRKLEESMPNDDVLLRCLKLTKHTLELIEDDLSTYLSLNSLYTGIVNYALTKTDNAQIYIIALNCLGLFALIDDTIAREALITFFNATKTSGDQVKFASIIGIIDIISTFGINIIAPEKRFGFLRLFYKLLLDDSPKLQALMGEGISKLFLADIFKIENELNSGHEEEEEEIDESEKELFLALLLSYFNSSNGTNYELKQVLAFCIPVYCYSHPNHQLGLATISGELLLKASESNTIKATKILTQLLDWGNPLNLVQTKEENNTSHIWQALYILEVFDANELTKEYRRAIINNLSKIRINKEMEKDLLLKLSDSLERVKDLCEESHDNPNYQLDKSTVRNLQNFYDLVVSCLPSEDATINEIEEEPQGVENEAQNEVEEPEENEDSIIQSDEEVKDKSENESEDEM
ncbi:YCG1 [Candida pseudojiufengensis]|uniref:YCG1 n=1 Tax=Candida pseudojiufengensis TaxID=497109 RepID=UPI0022240B53|nr:YCG1 [Candida pseudojiufengensis]KAI5967021.1 YCG1 [Candida pseudojiufengensis]